MNPSSMKLLSLGDSYTIGENVLHAERFPNQVVRRMHEKGIPFDEPVLIATTGWTTDELAGAIREAALKDTFDFVTLLIGVNNQYRERSLENYRVEFEELLKTAVSFARGRAERVVVLSIPDWSVTPFAEGRNRKRIAGEIDSFNAVNRRVSLQYGVHYIDITTSTRQHTGWLAEDGLHPSGEEYAVWAMQVAEVMTKELEQQRE